MIKKTRKVENKKRISKRFESQRPVRNIEEVLSDMDETARGIMRYGVENAGIADLMDEAEQNLDADYWEADKEGDEETKKAIEDEMERMENEATECCGKIIDAIDSVWPVSELTPAQKQRLGWELEDLKAYDTRAMEDPNTFVKLIVAEYALSEDNGLLEALEFACQNALDETEEIDMDESVQRRRRNLRRVIESRRARAKKESKRHTRKFESRENKRWFVIDLNTTEESDSLEKALETAEWWMEIQRDQCESADDDELLHWLDSPEQGLDAGDVEVYEVDLDEVDLDDITDYNGRISGRQIISLLDPVKEFSGKSVIRDVAEERGLI